MGLVLPVVYYGLIPLVVLSGRVCCQHDGSWNCSGFRKLWWVVFALFAIAFALFACGRYTHWLARQLQFAMATNVDKPGEPAIRKAIIDTTIA